MFPQSLTYAATQAGTETVSVTANDGGNTGSGGALQGSASTVVTVSGNDTPAITPASATLTAV